jgi:hypothetical protein
VIERDHKFPNHTVVAYKVHVLKWRTVTQGQMTELITTSSWQPAAGASLAEIPIIRLLRAVAGTIIYSTEETPLKTHERNMQSFAFFLRNKKFLSKLTGYDVRVLLAANPWQPTSERQRRRERPDVL